MPKLTGQQLADWEEGKKPDSLARAKAWADKRGIDLKDAGYVDKLRAVSELLKQYGITAKDALGSDLATIAKAMKGKATPEQTTAAMLRSYVGPTGGAAMMQRASPTVLRSGAAKTANDLPMDEASRMARAREMGFDVDNPVYHGTTHKFDEFADVTGNPEGYFGKGHYFTDSSYDATGNYAGRGPDLTGRIEQRAEQLLNERGIDYNDRSLAAAKKMAAMELEGGDARVIEATLKGKTVDVGADNPTWLDYEQPIDVDAWIDDAADEFDISDFSDKVNFDEAVKERAYELAQEASYDVEPQGAAARVMDALKELSYEYDDMDFGKISESVMDDLFDGGISADKLDELLRNSEGLMYATDEQGRLASGDIIRQAFNKAGFDNIAMDADLAFKNMDIPQGTRHYITTEASNIRDIRAAFDPGKAGSANIMAAGGDTITPALLLEAQDEQQRKKDRKLTPPWRKNDK